MPDSVTELYTYNPDKAKTLLAQAGYPNGFKTSIVCRNDPDQVDYFSVIQDMWAKVGVELTIDPKEAGTLSSIQNSRNFEQIITGSIGPTGGLYRATALVAESSANCAFIRDDYIKGEIIEIQSLALSNPTEAKSRFKELMKYVLDQAWVIPRPVTPLYNLWWPWIKNYHGEFSLGFDNRHLFTQYVWMVI